MTPPDSELLLRVIASDDRVAFKELVLRHQSSVRRFLRYLTRGDIALADDLAQETFLQAYRGLARFQGTANFSTWLFGIAHNHWRNHARLRQNQNVSLDAAAIDTPVASSQLSSDLRHDLTEALKSLSNDEQLAIYLGYEQGHSHGEIARLLDWPLGTVKTHLNRGKEKLRHLLAVWNPQT